MTGSFYDCRGGWVRQTAVSPFINGTEDRSLIIRTKELPPRKDAE